jgi:hypothetical protein
MIQFRKAASMSNVERCGARELPPEFYRINNKWTGWVDGQRVTVYAGSLRHNPAKGVLVLRCLPHDSRRIGGKHCTVPQNGGALEIVECRGARLRVAMAKGGSFWFEVPRGLGVAA